MKARFVTLFFLGVLVMLPFLLGANEKGCALWPGCTDGQTQCWGNFEVQTCQNGAWVNTTDCSASGNICQADCSGIICQNAQCVAPPACTNGQTRCIGDGVQTCQNGAWVNTTFCKDTGKICQNGKCVDQCQTATDCTGVLPAITVGCPGGGYGSAHFTCLAGTCGIAYCCDPLPCPHGENWDLLHCKCVPVCTDGQTLCYGNEVQTCQNGALVNTTDCSASGDTCQNGKCVKECRTAADCTGGVLPALCMLCSDGSAGCARFACLAGTCEIAYCACNLLTCLQGEVWDPSTCVCIPI